jgi:hypothetical protein
MPAEPSEPGARAVMPSLEELRSPLAQGAAARLRPHAILGRILLHACNLLIAGGALAAYEHFSVTGASGPALASLLTAGGFALAPIRALLHSLFALERGVLHIVHVAGGLGVVGLAAGGAISGQPVLSHAALAPFAMMGAAQALMHSNHPRNARQAEALRGFVASLPQVERFSHPADLSSPANAARAASALSDIIGKARVLGETELDSDPGFQSALRRATARTGLTLGLDAVDRAIGSLAARPGAAPQVAALRRQLAAARRTVAAH